MEGVKARPIVLTQIQRDILQAIVRRTHCPQAIVRRAEVVLAAAAGLENAAIARRLGCDRDLARRWRGRFAEAQKQWAEQGVEWDQGVWTEKIAELLEDRERCGAPPTFTSEQLCQIVALACEKRPQDCDRPITHWTARELADEAIKRHIVVCISPRHVGRFLKSGRPASPPGALLAQQPGSNGKTRRIPATLRGGGRGLSGRSGFGPAGHAHDQHG